MEVIYFIEPTDDSVRMVTNDFSQKKPPYGDVHLLFLSKVRACSCMTNLFMDTWKENQKKIIQQSKESFGDVL